MNFFACVLRDKQLSRRYSSWSFEDNLFEHSHRINMKISEGLFKYIYILKASL